MSNSNLTGLLAEMKGQIMTESEKESLSQQIQQADIGKVIKNNDQLEKMRNLALADLPKPQQGGQQRMRPQPIPQQSEYSGGGGGLFSEIDNFNAGSYPQPQMGRDRDDDDSFDDSLVGLDFTPDIVQNRKKVSKQAPVQQRPLPQQQPKQAVRQKPTPQKSNTKIPDFDIFSEESFDDDMGVFEQTHRPSGNVSQRVSGNHNDITLDDIYKLKDIIAPLIKTVAHEVVEKMLIAERKNTEIIVKDTLRNVLKQLKGGK